MALMFEKACKRVSFGHTNQLLLEFMQVASQTQWDLSRVSRHLVFAYFDDKVDWLMGASALWMGCIDCLLWPRPEDDAEEIRNTVNRLLSTGLYAPSTCNRVYALSELRTLVCGFFH